MNVRILVYIPRSELFDNCTLAVKTIRTGFPTAVVTVYDNSPTFDCYAQVAKLTQAVKADVTYVGAHHWHHADWIKDMLVFANGPLVLLDGDVIFWENCETLTFDGLYAGYPLPLMWNEFAQVVSAPRVHTSFLWFNNPQALLAMIRARYPNAHDTTGHYCPCNPFMPDVKFVNGKAMFWDTCANLYNMVKATHFNDDVLLRYDHVTCASAFDVMKDRVCDPKGFEIMHEIARKDPSKLRNMWPGVKRYYQAMQQLGAKCLTS